MSEVDLHPISFGRVSLKIYNQTKELANFLPLLMKLPTLSIKSRVIKVYAWSYHIQLLDMNLEDLERGVRAHTLTHRQVHRVHSEG